MCTKSSTSYRTGGSSPAGISGQAGHDVSGAAVSLTLPLPLHITVLGQSRNVQLPSKGCEPGVAWRQGTARGDGSGVGRACAAKGGVRSEGGRAKRGGRAHRRRRRRRRHGAPARALRFGLVEHVEHGDAAPGLVSAIADASSSGGRGRGRRRAAACGRHDEHRQVGGAAAEPLGRIIGVVVVGREERVRRGAVDRLGPGRWWRRGGRPWGHRRR